MALAPVSDRTRREVLPRRRACYALVDSRSGGRCEVVLDGVRCRQRAVDHHHTRKPRSSHDDPDSVMHVCRQDHDRHELTPFCDGRLVSDPLGGGRFASRIVTKADKWAPTECA